jgi:septum formation inhibitor MinC
MAYTINESNTTIDASGVRHHAAIHDAGDIHVALPQVIIDGDISADGDIIADGILRASGIISAGGHIRASGTVIADGDLNAAGYIRAGGDIRSAGNIIADGILSSGGNISAGGDISADGIIRTGGDISADGDLRLGGDISAGGDIIADGTIRVNGLPVASTAQTDANLRLIAPLALAEGALDMTTVHSCPTVHCMAGWACSVLPNGAELEKKHGWFAAGAHLLGPRAMKLFFASDKKAAEFLRACQTT